MSTDIHYKSYGDPNSDTLIIWAHGWGQSHQSFEGLIQSLENLGHHIAIDFPGFGETLIPNEIWGSQDYANHLLGFIKTHSPNKPIIYIGHSFGCRVGLQLAIHNPETVAGLAIIGGAGLRRKRTLLQKSWLWTKVYTFKTLKKLIPFGLNEDWLKSKFVSPDYRNAGPIRPIMVKVIPFDESIEFHKLIANVMMVMAWFTQPHTY